MEIKLTYCAQVKQTAGCDEEKVDVEDGTTVSALLVQTADRIGEKFRALVLDGDGNPQRGVMVLVNEEPVFAGQATSLVLSNGDEVTLLPAMAGG